MRELTPRQRQVFNFIKQFISKNARSPSIYEIGEHFLFSAKAADDHVRALVRKKYIGQKKGKQLSLTILKERPPMFHTLDELPQSVLLENRDAVIVPVMEINEQDMILRDEAVISKKVLGNIEIIEDCVALMVNSNFDIQACTSVQADDLLFVLKKWQGHLAELDLIVTESLKVMHFGERRGQRIFGKVVYLQRSLN